MTPDDQHLDQIVNDVVQRLERREGTQTDATNVRALVDLEWARYRDARVRTFLPVLVRRAVTNDVLSRASDPQPEPRADQ